MEAIRSVVKPKNHNVQVTLPNSFNGEYVEVIVLPYKQKNIKSKDNKSELQKFLLEAPTMSDDDYNEFLEKRKRFNQWKPNFS
jgi:hypothetical protein